MDRFMTYPANSLSLVADIGGTNTRLALAQGTHLLQDTVHRFKNADFDSLQHVVKQYLFQMDDVDPSSACFAVAGPVEGTSAKMTNLNWTIDAHAIGQVISAENVRILNDLQAQGYALGHIEPDHVTTVLAGSSAERYATQLVVGVGTGFNATPVFEAPHGRFVAPAEAGHADLPIRTSSDISIATAVADHSGAPSVEDILSGRGFEKLHCAISDSPERLSGSQIIKRAQSGDAAATATIEHFVTVLGATCGNLALTLLPFGGITLVGGMARAMQPFLLSHGFEAAFHDKGRFSEFMKRFPVNVVEDDYAALTGCAVMLDQSAG